MLLQLDQRIWLLNQGTTDNPLIPTATEPMAIKMVVLFQNMSLFIHSPAYLDSIGLFIPYHDLLHHFWPKFIAIDCTIFILAKSQPA